ncbi:MAG: hypothetical protein COV69_00290 [Parcubacteria group bacterium CG11_big_fil_rev_8_21_14_0_20_39_14]|nr:MAG: hypothetical protein COV69_00290 [Parcubacteria group bacterium CG11_big_fil_rev_8_21_14_0_20_39_14]
MTNGYKYTKLPAEFQKELERFSGEVREIQRQIEEKKREKKRLEDKIGEEKTIVFREDSQKQQRLSSLEKEIQELDREIKNLPGKYSSSIKALEQKIVELSREIEEIKKKSLELKTEKIEKVQAEKKSPEELMRQKAELQTKIKEIESKIRMLDIEIGKASRVHQKTAVHEKQRESIQLEQQIKLKERGKKSLEGEINEIRGTISVVSDNLSRRKFEAIREKERLEKELKTRASSLNLQKLESVVKELTSEIQRLERRKSDAQNDLAMLRTKMKSLPPVSVK